MSGLRKKLTLEHNLLHRKDKIYERACILSSSPAAAAAATITDAAQAAAAAEVAGVFSSSEFLSLSDVGR